MKSVERSRAEDKYAELKKRDVSILADLEKASKSRTEKSAKLRELRLQKEEEERKAGTPVKKPAKAKASVTKARKA